MATVIVRMQQRRDSTARWALVNPVLRAGEMGVDTDVDRFKIGDGTTAWSDLPFLNVTVANVETIILGLVPGAVIEALAADDTPADAAAAAVDTALEDAGVVRGGSSLAVDAVIGFAITDEYGNRSWLEFGLDGLPTPHAADGIAKGLGLQSTGAISDQPLSVAITDKDGNRSWLEADLEGLPSEHAVAGIARRLNLGEVTTDGIATVAGLACWGDSLTAGEKGAGAGGGIAVMPYPESAGMELGVPIFNGGKSAHGSAQIATRQGGLRPLLTVAGNQIPSAGPVAVTAISPTDGWRTGTVAGATISCTGILNGIPGTLVQNLTDLSFTFTRTTAGSITDCPAGTPFIGTDGVPYRSHVAVYWAGTNNSAQTDAILRDIADMIAWQAPNSPRFLVLPLTSQSATSAINLALAATWPDNFYDLRAALIANGLADLGITPTTQDNTDRTNNVVPTSLRSDGTHFTDASYRLIGRYVAAELRRRGWFPAA